MTVAEYMAYAKTNWMDVSSPEFMGWMVRLKSEKDGSHRWFDKLPASEQSYILAQPYSNWILTPVLSTSERA